MKNTKVKKQKLLGFMQHFVEKYVLSNSERYNVDLMAQERGGCGPRAYKKNKQGIEIGWWVHPNRYVKELNWLFDTLQLKGNESVLSIGCGPSFHEIAFAYHFPNINFLATDLDSKEIITAQQIAYSLDIKNIHFKNINAEQINVVAKPHSFDYIISMAALHDVKNLDVTFCGIAKLLKSSGKFVFTYNPLRRTAQFPDQPPLEKILKQYLKLIHNDPLITPEDALQYYGSLEIKSQEQRGYGIVQEARIAIV